MICPNCGNKIPEDSAYCLYCKLRVESILKASNEQAKIAYRNKQKDKVVYSTYKPYDVNKTKLLLLSIFLGWVGAHCFYVGRYVKASILLVCAVLTICIGCLPKTWFLYTYFGGTFIGVLGFICVFNWWMDIILIVFNKFKIPVVLKEI